jgi:cytosine/adenosine deaminase-related metal-dependent hydrolase
VDGDARAEIASLAQLECLSDNTVLVHGVAIEGRETARVLQAGASLVWCPSSNEFLFGETARVRAFATAARLALGTDSRLSGEGDLLDELRAARRTGQLSAAALLRTVTTDAARLLRVQDAGRLRAGAAADLVILRRTASDPYESIVSATRNDVRLTMIGGKPLVGDTAMARVFVARKQPFAQVTVDGAPRLLAGWIAARVKTMTVREPGLEVPS